LDAAGRSPEEVDISRADDGPAADDPFSDDPFSEEFDE